MSRQSPAYLRRGNNGHTLGVGYHPARCPPLPSITRESQLALAHARDASRKFTSRCCPTQSIPISPSRRSRARALLFANSLLWRSASNISQPEPIRHSQAFQTHAIAGSRACAYWAENARSDPLAPSSDKTHTSASQQTLARTRVPRQEPCSPIDGPVYPQSFDS
jgi:hypothetical protein